MTFSYSFFLVLLLLFPGLSLWAGWRAGQRTDLLRPSPEKPNSTLTLFMIVLGTLCGHLLGASLFAVQAGFCRVAPLCLPVDFDPNLYRALLHGAQSARGATDFAIEAWLFCTLLIGGCTGGIAFWLSRREAVSSRLAPITFGWLAEAAQAVKERDTFVVAYVVSKIGHDGAYIAYEGAVQHLALDEDQSIKLVVLNNVDRFLVRVTRHRVELVGTAGAPISQLHITAGEIANVALEVIRLPSPPIGEDGAEPAAGQTRIGIST